MKEITKKLHSEVMEGFRPVAEQLVQDGASEEDIVKIFQSLMKEKQRKFYEKPPYHSIRDIINLKGLEGSPDSKAESIFYQMLISADIKFDFQFKIGPYRADYLINKFLVLELDGPHHWKHKDDAKDRYLERMGYKVLRIPLWILAASPGAVIDEIKEVIEL